MTTRRDRRPQTAATAPKVVTQNVLSDPAAEYLTPSSVRSAIVRIADYQPHPRNYNGHPARQIEAIAASLRKFGQPRPVAVWRGYYLAGHGVVAAARSIGWTTIRADVLPDDYPEHLALAYVVADNELARLSDPDEAALFAIMQESRERDPELLQAMGYTDQELQKLLRDVEKGKAGEAQADAPDEGAALLEKWRVEPGQIWQCGRHRLMCGDSTSQADIDRLLRGDRAALFVTDPPYNVGVNFGDETDDNKTKTHYEQFTRAWFEPWAARSDRQIVTPAFANLALWVYLFRDRIHMIAPWIKTNAVTRGYISQFACWEPILFFGEADPDWEPILFLQNDRKQKGWTRIRTTDVFSYPISSQPNTGGHPTPKPLRMFADMINSYSEIDDLVCDAFGGTGTTMIAAEQTIRRAALMEISPKWSAVILERFQIEAGDTPLLLEPQPHE